MKIAPKFRKGAIVHAALMMMGASAATAIAADKTVDVGKFEYEGSCAVCHGITGKGNGPFMGQLATRVPDITLLARSNGGVFPFDRVYQVIDGRQELKAHGSREMPIWGRSFRMQSSAFFENYPAHDAESSARSRILALTEYVYRLQAK
ncbi:MAG: cytochrome c [Sulfuritalea sp.]|nr:cytochrome c [Sulfuritalea sp.]